MNRPDPSPGLDPGLRILFVCSGNTCRSPMAEVLALQAAEELDCSGVTVRSSGTSTLPGLAASDGARRAARRHGLSLESHSSTPISSELVDWADVVLTMGISHLNRVRELGGEEKGSLLRAFAEGTEDEGSERSDLSISDPFGGDDQVYEETFQTLKTLVQQIFERIRKEVRE